MQAEASPKMFNTIRAGTLLRPKWSHGSCSYMYLKIIYAALFLFAQALGESMLCCWPQGEPRLSVSWCAVGLQMYGGPEGHAIRRWTCDSVYATVDEIDAPIGGINATIGGTNATVSMRLYYMIL